MKTATVRQLRHDFGSVLNWVEEGEAVSISKRGRVVALLSPPPPANPSHRNERPDFVARFKGIYGDKILSENIVVEDRNPRPF